MILPNRKPNRLSGYDYGAAGAYFVTICVEGRRELLSKVLKREGELPTVELKDCGMIAEQQIQALMHRFERVKISEYVIMPDHIHMMVIISGQPGGASPSPTTQQTTLPDVMRVFKSMTTRVCRNCHGIDKLFQRSYMEHIIRDRKDYETKLQYIRQNPMRWFYRSANTNMKP